MGNGESFKQTVLDLVDPYMEKLILKSPATIGYYH